MKRFSAVLLLAWWVQVYSDGQFLHGGAYATLERCRIAGNNLATTYRGLGYKNVTWICVDHGGRS